MYVSATDTIIAVFLEDNVFALPVASSTPIITYVTSNAATLTVIIFPNYANTGTVMTVAAQR